jgi:hypothetical protein
VKKVPVRDRVAAGTVKYVVGTEPVSRSKK